ncbi:MAG: carboxypeptidase M32 [Pseudomonadota bacterium]|nr:carboxypeptidase M32 [Pseudomonadota bacterium]
MTQSAYHQLELRFKRLSVLSGAEAMLHWDMSTMMPSGGVEARAEQLAELKAIQHGLLVSKETTELITKAESDKNELNDWQASNLRNMKRRWVKATALSEDLVIALSKACSTCETTWRTARSNSNFAEVCPALEEVLNLTRQTAQAKGEKLGLSAYDALLDDYEPGARTSDIDPIFEELEAFLPDFLGLALEEQSSRQKPILPTGFFKEEKQKALGQKLMRAFGFDFNHGRLDTSLHPFCGGTPDDVRITTRYDERDFTSSLMGVLHETGHALYERGLPKKWRGQPVGEALGMSIHESQSLLIEMQICRSREFLKFSAPIMKAAFNGSGPEWRFENLSRLFTQIKPGFIRVDADEVTYPAHIIVRYNLERALIEGDMEIVDLPSSWNSGIKKFLGIKPTNDRDGCLQDVHWFDGAWGYFPTYTLGAMIAAQLYETAKVSKPEIKAGISEGNFKPLFSWLIYNVHSQGSLTNAKDLLKKVTKKSLSTKIFKSHLQSRYLEKN